jgi:hypothetical protein
MNDYTFFLPAMGDKKQVPDAHIVSFPQRALRLSSAGETPSASAECRWHSISTSSVQGDYRDMRLQNTTQELATLIMFAYLCSSSCCYCSSACLSSQTVKACSGTFQSPRWRWRWRRGWPEKIDGRETLAGAFLRSFTVVG